jgi:predicted Zn-dependent peptidase
MTVRQTRLPSGLTVLTHAMPHLESTALGVWVGTGSRSERDGEHGLSHLLEHMAFKGTRRRTAIQIAEEIEAVGGEVNAATSVETTSYYARVLKDDVPLAIDILADILRNSVFDPTELEREQHVILQEIGAAYDTPDDRVYDLFSEAAYPGQPIGRNILGTPQTVQSVMSPMLDRYLSEHYRGPSMVLAAAGALDHDALVELAGEDCPTSRLVITSGKWKVVKTWPGSILSVTWTGSLISPTRLVTVAMPPSSSPRGAASSGWISSTSPVIRSTLPVRRVIVPAL